MSLSSPPAPAKPNLVVVRAGRSSLHHDWLAMPYEARNWDLVVSYFDEAAFEAHIPQTGVQAVLVRGGKWDGLFKTFQEVTGHDRYSYIWLPDDDIATTGEAINKMFGEADAFDLAICQPALTHNSYFTYFFVMQCPGFRLRYTNFVEIMVPCLNQEMFRAALPFFEGTMSGFGLDFLWCRFPQAGRWRGAILDSVAVHHTRPIGSQLRKNIVQSGAGTAQQEGADLLARFGAVVTSVPLAYGGETIEGQQITSRFAMAPRMARGYWSARQGFLDPAHARQKTIQIFKRQLIKKFTLEPLVL